MMNTTAANGHLFANYPGVFDYTTAPPSHMESFSGVLDKVSEKRENNKSHFV